MGNTRNTNYGKDLFVSRKEIFRLGYYEAVSNLLINITKELILNKSNVNILDVGCGEGYYTYRMGQDHDLLEKCNFFALDLSKEGINLATQYSIPAIWCVADLVKMPFRSATMDMILDILTPANYHEFNRVLRKNGYIVKVIPGNDYLREIRELVSSKLINKENINSDTLKYSVENLKVVLRKHIKYEFPVGEGHLKHLLTMTPLANGRVPEELSGINLDKVTIDYEILVGQKIV